LSQTGVPHAAGISCASRAGVVGQGTLIGATLALIQPSAHVVDGALSLDLSGSSSVANASVLASVCRRVPVALFVGKARCWAGVAEVAQGNALGTLVLAHGVGVARCGADQARALSVTTKLEGVPCAIWVGLASALIGSVGVPALHLAASRGPPATVIHDTNGFIGEDVALGGAALSIPHAACISVALRS